MAEKRMFSNKVIGSDEFLEMPDSTQNLYFHLSMNADDDGFVDKVKSIMRMTGKKDDDLKILIAKKFIIPFDSGVIVIKHWRVNNYLRNDRYKETQYLEEKSKIAIEKNGEYTTGIPVVYQVDTQNSIEKTSIELKEKYNKKEKFVKPTVEEVDAYCKERKNDIDAEAFVSFYESKGWLVGKVPMKNWKSAVITWEKARKKESQNKKKVNFDYKQHEYSNEETSKAFDNLEDVEF